MEKKVDFVSVDMPGATPFMLHVYAAVAEEERRMIASRTKAGLAAAKLRGVVLGNAKLAADNRTAAAHRALALRPMLQELGSLSARRIAAELNGRQVTTPTGAPWSAKTVIRVQRRLSQLTSSGRSLIG
jgi:DNA invertase Pin-like site-specific DNA recombinase